VWVPELRDTRGHEVERLVAVGALAFSALPNRLVVPELMSTEIQSVDGILTAGTTATG
jgi:hypothetical protein